MEPGPHQQPSTAELARTALAQARVATLISRGRGPSVDALAIVSVDGSANGEPLVQLEQTSPMVRRLAACPVATIAIAAPSPFVSLQLTGPAMQCKGDGEDLRSFRLSLLSARLVAWRKVVPVPLGAFHAASADPLWPHAAQVLDHLGQAHAPELLACARAHGQPQVQAVEPRAIDRYGLELHAPHHRCRGDRAPAPLPGWSGRVPDRGDHRPAGRPHLSVRRTPSIGVPAREAGRGVSRGRRTR